MHKRFIAAMTIFCLLAATVSRLSAAPPQPGLKPLLSEVRKLVEKHYPEATVTLQGDTIHFEFQTRKFLIHDPGRGGTGWQDAREESGPQPGGISCDIELRSGAYLGAAAVPQEFDLRYFKLYLSAPYSKKLDCHLYIHLRYPERTSKEFLEEFRTLTGKFEGLLDAEPLPPLPTARLNVIRYWSPDRGNVRSYQEQDGKQVLHGVQVSFGENNRLREMSVYNAGVLEHRTQFYADGFTFRAQRREHNGDGRDVIYAPIRKPIAEIGSESEGVGFAPLKSQAVVYEGLVKGDRPWSGSFLVRGIAGFRAVLNLEEYREGLLFSTKPFPVEKFSLPTVDPDAGKWLWEYPDWPNR